MPRRRYGATPPVNPVHAIVTGVTAIITAVTAYIAWSAARKTPDYTDGVRR